MATALRLRVLMTVVLFFVLAEGMFYFALPIALETLTNNVALVGLLMSLPSLSSFLSTELFGELSDKLGRKSIITWGIIFSIIIYAAIYMSNNIFILAILLAFFGIRDSMFYTPFEAKVCDIAPKGREGEYNGLAWFSYDIGYAVSGIFAALVISKGVGFVYTAAAVLTLVSLIVLQFFLHDGSNKMSFRRTLKFTKKSFTSFFSNLEHANHMTQNEKLVYFFSFSNSVMGAVVWIIVPLMTLDLTLSLVDAALLMFAYTIPCALADVVGGKIFDRYKSKWFFVFGFLTCAVAFTYFGLTRDISAVPLFLLSAFMLSAIWVASMATVSSLHTGKHKGEHTGLFFSSDYLGSFVGAILTGILGEMSLVFPVYAAAILSIVCLFASFWFEQ